MLARQPILWSLQPIPPLSFSTTGSARSRAACANEVRGFIEELIRCELDEALARRPCYRRASLVTGMAAARVLTGSFGRPRSPCQVLDCERPTARPPNGTKGAANLSATLGRRVD